jgi:hypothetical protein
MTNAQAPADGPQPAARPLADVMRELADHADNVYEGYISIDADTIRAWADRIKELEAALEGVPEMLEEGIYDISAYVGIPTSKVRAKIDAIQTLLTPPAD